MVFSLSALWWRRIRGLWKLLDGRDWLRGKLGLVLMGGALFSKSLIQFSVEGWSCVPSLLFDLKPNYGGGNEDNGDLLQKVSCMHCYTQCPQSCSRPLPPHTSTRDSWTLTDKFGSVSKKQESSRKTSTSALLTMPKPLTVWITTNHGKFFKRWEYQTTWPASWEICM